MKSRNKTLPPSLLLEATRTWQEITEKASKYEYYYTLTSEGSLITSATVIGWAQKTGFPIPRANLCEIKHYTACLPSETYQNPFTHHKKFIYYVPASGVYLKQLGNLKAIDPNKEMRSCIAPNN